MDSPPPINQNPPAPSPPKIDLRQILEGVVQSDIGDYMIAIGAGLNAFKNARRCRKERRDKRNQVPNED